MDNGTKTLNGRAGKINPKFPYEIKTRSRRSELDKFATSLVRCPRICSPRSALRRFWMVVADPSAGKLKTIDIRRVFTRIASHLDNNASLAVGGTRGNARAKIREIAEMVHAVDPSSHE